MDIRIAVIGMSGRFPGATSILEFWDNILAGRECATRFSRDQLCPSAQREADLYKNSYVPVRGILADAEHFDFAFFGYAPNEAMWIDPQQRLFLETSWNAMRDAGYEPSELRSRRVGVFAGCSENSFASLFPETASGWDGQLQEQINRARDFVATRTSYCLDLHGPSVNVQSGCSTSLVAIHEACRSLLAQDCNLAVAGGSAVRFPQNRGHIHKEGGIYSSDGNCRPFDANSSGTFSGNGVGAVVLKRFEDAQRDGDRIYATVLATLVNNDGARKAGFTAPSVEGQRELLEEALDLSEVSRENIGLVEAHGTATPLGDPIEFEALALALSDSQRCTLGSVKANIGHLDAAAGVAGFIKIVLAIYQGVIPPHPNFERRNPHLNNAAQRFRFATLAEPWMGERFACVQSTGVGGTNAVAILGAASDPPRGSPTPWTFLPFSVPNEKCVLAQARAIDEHVRLSRPDLALLGNALASRLDTSGLRSGTWVKYGNSYPGGNSIEVLPIPQIVDTIPRRQVLVFPGGGAYFPGAVRALAVLGSFVADIAQDVIAAIPDEDLRSTVFALMSGQESEAVCQASLSDLRVSLLMTLCLNAISSRLLRLVGFTPDIVIGHSLGEYNAVVEAGGMDFATAAAIVIKRGEIFDALPAMALLNVEGSRDDLDAILARHPCELIAYNTPRNHTVSTTREHEHDLCVALSEADFDVQRLPIAAAAHSALLDPVLDEFRVALSQFSFAPLSRPMISNIDGRVIGEGTVLGPNYWAQHLRAPVQFATGLKNCAASRHATWIQAGVGSALAHMGAARGDLVFSTLGSAPERAVQSFLSVLGGCWLQNKKISAPGLPKGGLPTPIALPAKAFDSRRLWPEQVPGSLQRPQRPRLYEERPRRFRIPIDFCTDRGQQPCFTIRAGDNMAAAILAIRDFAQAYRGPPFCWVSVEDESMSLERLLPLRTAIVCLNQHYRHVHLRIAAGSREDLTRVDWARVFGTLSEAECLQVQGDSLCEPGYQRLPPLPDLAALKALWPRTPIAILLGGTGRVGLALSRQILSLGGRVIVTGRRRSLRAGFTQQNFEGAFLHRAWADLLDNDRFSYVPQNMDDASWVSDLCKTLSVLGVRRADLIIALASASAETSIRRQPDTVTADDLVQQSLPKGAAFPAIEELAERVQVSRVIYASSNASRLGGPGLLPYGIANAEVDALCLRSSKACSINFDAFRFSNETTLIQQGTSEYSDDDDLLSIVSYALWLSEARNLIVSCSDFEARAREWMAIQDEEIGSRSFQSTSELLKGIWFDLLGYPDLPPEANFFSLGGHSLLALRMFSRLRGALGIDVTIRDLSMSPTLGALSNLIDSRVSIQMAADGALTDVSMGAPPEDLSTALRQFDIS